ncbi:hypothetical protein L3Q82_010786 [Scortum barcoo]|uniref:Uncharacterized protein n=1 Tax=Scortum barcoo TaxID=214431 RepID=A0ACB8W8F6_9TELE|nr:hypothetical protein L3Q82_010786 [Scortum barcoo]
MTAFYLRFLPRYLETTAPLRALLKLDAPWSWTPACSAAVRTLKAQLTSPPVLAHFDLQNPTFVTCDASNTAVAYVPVRASLHAADGPPGPHGPASHDRIRPQAFTGGRRGCRRITNFTTQFTPGRDNVVADLLSRATPCSALETAQDPQEPELILMLHTPLQGAVSLQELEAASAQDPVLTQLRTFIRGGWPTKVPEDLQPFYRVKAELSCWNDVCVARGLCTVIPSALRARVLTMMHEGHLGFVKPLPWPSAPWSHVQVDICSGLYGVPQHQCFLLVAYDLHSKWPEVLPTGSVTTRVVTDFLSSLFARWGVPDTITTDNGPQFVSADFTAFAEGRRIKHIRTALYHPQANGGVERFNQTLKNGLRAHLADGLPFPSALQSTLLHYRATPHATTGSSPALLMLGRELQLPLDRLRPHTGDRSGRPATPHETAV